MLQGLEELLKDLLGKWLINLVLQHVLVEVATSTQLHAKVNVFLVIVRFMIAHNIRVVNLLHDLDLVPEILEVLRMQFRFLDNLDSDFERFILSVASSKHFTIRARA